MHEKNNIDKRIAIKEISLVERSIKEVPSSTVEGREVSSPRPHVLHKAMSFSSTSPTTWTESLLLESEEWPSVAEYTYDHFAVSDAIAWLMGHHLKSIIVIFVLLFAVLVLFFAILFFFDRESVVAPHSRVPSFGDCCWLSLQTFTTIGYGSLSPYSTYTHVICAMNSFLGILYTAVLTSVFMAHLMTPKAHWKISDVLCIHRDEEGRLLLKGRTVFAPGKIYYDMEVVMQIILIKRNHDTSIKNTVLGDCRMETPKSIFTGCSWEFTHLIDETSPLYPHVSNDVKTLTDIKEIYIKMQGKDPNLQSLATLAKRYDPLAVMMNEEFENMVQSRETNSKSFKRRITEKIAGLFLWKEKRAESSIVLNASKLSDTKPTVLDS